MTYQPSRFHLFQAYGVELEYMIVDEASLEIRPICDELLKHELGHYGMEVEKGVVTWSNELVSHVVELKSTEPVYNLNELEAAFVENVKTINAVLGGWKARLMPSAMHPFMLPLTQTRIWPHQSNEIYEIYNSIFDCRGHGWSNLQSTHVNLPFYDDEEFAVLHAAVRLVLPLVPALCASSPIVEGKITGSLDTRLKYYKTNQQKIPCVTGRIIPEAIYSKRNYLNSIYDRIRKELDPYDPNKIMDPIWVNSRGAIARFDRGSIEIRLIDVQECPAADVAITALLTETIKALVRQRFSDHETQAAFKTDSLVQLLDVSMERGEDTMVSDAAYLRAFGLTDEKATMREIWTALVDKLSLEQPGVSKWRPELDVILRNGSLATRILRALAGAHGHHEIRAVYRQLCECLSQNRMFIP